MSTLMTNIGAYLGSKTNGLANRISALENRVQLYRPSAYINNFAPTFRYSCPNDNSNGVVTITYYTADAPNVSYVRLHHPNIWATPTIVTEGNITTLTLSLIPYYRREAERNTMNLWVFTDSNYSFIAACSTAQLTNL